MEISDQVKAVAARSQRKDLIRKWGFVLVLAVGGAVLLVAIVNDGDFLSSIFGVLGLLVLFVLYFLPSFIADRRGVVNKSQVRVVNLFLGWSFIGWVVALAMSFSPNVEE